MKGLVGSLLIHSSLVVGYLLYAQDEPKKIADKEKIITINIQNYNLPKQNILKHEPTPIEKAKQKPKIKPIEKKKEILKPKIEPKEEVEKPIKDVTEQEVKTEVFQSNIVEKPQDTKDTIQMQQEAFIQTNFTIIRNMVLSNLSYPNIARKMGWQGVVSVRLVVDANGILISYSITESSGKKHLDQAALDAVESIKHNILPKPKTETAIILPIGFKLQ
jgi:protein TonB